MIITAEDRLTMQAGKSSIALNKNGDIAINGKDIFMEGSGPLTIKGSKVTNPVVACTGLTKAVKDAGEKSKKPRIRR
jgi:hypothetical protein